MARWEALIGRARAFAGDEGPAVARQLAPPPERRAAVGQARRRGRLVFAVDASGSREDGWNASKQLTDTFFTALPAGQLEIALAAHSGERITFTPFTANAGTIRRAASRIKCEAGLTQLHGILRQVLSVGRVGVVVYISDSSEEDDDEARRLADALNRCGTRVIILHDRAPTLGVKIGTHIFAEIAERTGGAVLPFESSSLGRLRDLLTATAWLAAGGRELLAAKTQTAPAARLLLDSLAEPPRTAVARNTGRARR